MFCHPERSEGSHAYEAIIIYSCSNEIFRIDFLNAKALRKSNTQYDNTTNMKKTYQFGNLAEKIAQIFLILKGYKILAKNYKSRFGEIDIIARKSKIIIFIEVKARKNNELIEAILRKNQLDRIKRSAQYYIATNSQFENFDIRFDFILFEKSFFPQHFKSYF